MQRKKVNFLDVCNLKYEMIHGTDEDQVKIAKVYHILMQARADILDEWSTPSQLEDPCTC